MVSGFAAVGDEMMIAAREHEHVDVVAGWQSRDGIPHRTAVCHPAIEIIVATRQSCGHQLLVKGLDSLSLVNVERGEFNLA